NHADLLWSSGDVGSVLGTFVNMADGELRVTGGTSLAAPFVNAGSLFVATPESVSFAGIATTGEVVLETGGVSAQADVQTDGETLDEGAILEVPTYRLLGGSFIGFGTIIGDVENRDTFAPADGTLLVMGNYDQAIGGTLVLEVGDPALQSAPPLTVEGAAT